MGNHMNTLEQIKRETRDDARLYACIRDLYDQGVSLSDLKALIPDIRRTREQLQLKRMLQNNNEVLMAMFSQEMSFLLDAKERHEELEFKKLDQLIRQQQSFRKASAETGPVKKLKRIFIVVFVSVNEHYHVRILLDGSGFTKVRKHRSFIRTAFYRTA